MELTLSKQLADNLAYYVEDTNKRCYGNILGGVSTLKGCYYSGTTIGKETDGCFVGRFLKPEDRIKVDKILLGNPHGTDVANLIDIAKENDINIPDIIKNNLKIFEKFQYLHDNEFHWSENSLTNNGRLELKDIIEVHNLDIIEFEKFL